MALTNRRPGYLIQQRTNGQRAGRTVIAWACLALLAFNLLSGAALPGQPAAAGTNGIVICTAVGMVVLDPPSTPANGQSRKHETVCVFCLPLMHGGQDIVEGPGMAAPLLPMTAPPAPVTAQVAIVSRLTGSATPRAPPSA